MRRKAHIFVLLSLLLAALSCVSQTVTITGTVRDPSGVPYRNGNGRAVLVPQNVNWLFGTNPVPTPVIISGLDSSGHFSINVTNTSIISPANLLPKWQFSFCSDPNLPGQVCFTMTPMVLTTNQDISVQIQAQSVPLPSTGGGGGNLSTSGSPNSPQIAQFTDPTHVTGLPTTGALGSVVLSVGPTLTGNTTIGALNLSTITGSAQCLHTDTSGNVTGTGSDCGSGGGGGGNVSSSGTPTNTQIAQWIDATHIQGLGTTGSGSVVLATSPTLTGTALANNLTVSGVTSLALGSSSVPSRTFAGNPQLGSYVTLTGGPHQITQVVVAGSPGAQTITLTVSSPINPFSYHANDTFQIANLPSSPTNLTSLNGVNYLVTSATATRPTATLVFSSTTSIAAGTYPVAQGFTQTIGEALAGHEMMVSRLRSSTANASSVGSFAGATRDAWFSRADIPDDRALDTPLIRGSQVSPTNAVGLGTITVNGVHSSGASTLNVSKAGSGNWSAVAGDQIAIAHSLNDAGQQVYAVTANVTVTGGSTASISISPPLLTNLTGGEVVAPYGVLAQVGDAWGAEILGPILGGVQGQSFQLSGVKQPATSVTVASGFDFSWFLGSDNLFRCQLSVALGGGACAANTIASTLTSNNIPKATGVNTLANSALVDNGTIITTTNEPLDTGTTGSHAFEIANAGVTGTTLAKLAKITGNPSTAVITATTDSSGAVGIVVGGAGTAGNAQIADAGYASCVFDNATTAGDYVQISGTNAGNCHDTGSGSPPSSGQVIGRVQSTNGGAGTYKVAVFQQTLAGGGGGSTAFSALTTGTNTAAAMGVGTGATLTPAGIGQIAGTQQWMFPSLPKAALSVNNSGGSLSNSTTIFVVYTLNTVSGETNPSADTSIGTGVSCTGGNQCQVVVTAPTAFCGALPCGGFTGYTVYSSASIGAYAEKKQAASTACVNITANCSINVVGAGATVANANTAFSGPSPQGSSLCPFPVTPTLFVPRDDGNYYPYGGIDPTTDAVNGPPSPGGTPTICGRFWFNDTKISPPAFKNSFVLIRHDFNSSEEISTNQNRALAVNGTTPSGFSGTIYGMEAIQAELDFNCNGCSVNGSPDGEVSVGSFQMSDNSSTHLNTSGEEGLLRLTYFNPGTSNLNPMNVINSVFIAQAGKTYTSGDEARIYSAKCEGTSPQAGLACSHLWISPSGGANFGNGQFGIQVRQGLQGTFTPTANKDYFIRNDISAWDSSLNGPIEAYSLNNAFFGAAFAMNGSFSAAGSLSTTQIANTTIGTGVTCPGSPGASTYTYVLVPVDSNGQGVALPTMTSPGTCANPLTSGNPAAIGPFNLPNSGSGNAMNQAARVDIYRTGGPMSTGKIGSLNTCTNPVLRNGCSTFNDTGLAGDSTTPPANNTTGSIGAAGPIILAGTTTAAATIQTSNTNQSLTIAPNGTGPVIFNNGAVATPSVVFANNTSWGWYSGTANQIGLTDGSNPKYVFDKSKASLEMANTQALSWSSTGLATGTIDTCFSRAAANTVLIDTDTNCSNGLGKIQAQLYLTNTNCSAVGTAANPSVASCSAASAGAFSCATNASTGTCTINTTAVTANSVIIVTNVADEGTRLSVTCNTTADTGLAAPRVATKTAATSFTINLGTFATNPLCFDYVIIN